jgi:hypothetical protein
MSRKKLLRGIKTENLGYKKKKNRWQKRTNLYWQPLKKQRTIFNYYQKKSTAGSACFGQAETIT